VPINVDLLSFEVALQKGAALKRHVLLGNGFSRALRNDIFSYDALFDRADFNTLSPAARQAFSVLTTSDFEVVMRALRAAAALVEVYEQTNPNLAARLRADADGLREVLVRTIASNHPSRPGDMPHDAYKRCREFLAYFGSIYTLNYDLLLYWALMQEELEPQLKADDGFRTPDDGPQDYVSWEVEKTDQQSVFYLHGALHIFDAETEIKKYTWINTGIPLIDQIREALNNGLYPLFVAEGESKQKLARIKHNEFLSRAYRSFAKIGGALYVYGHSMAPNDEHIIRLIEKNRVGQLHIALYGNPLSEANQRIVDRALKIQKARPAKRPIEVSFFDAATAHVWG
jgi:uncharacterized protein DUF4917